MPHVVTERCVKCRYTDCCAVCPVECFYEVSDPPMLVIDPATCIDCGLCVPACPIAAIWPADELPPEYANWADKNQQLFGGGANIKIKKDPLPGALSLAQLQARELERGWTIKEPSGAGSGEHAAPAAAPASGAALTPDAVLAATRPGRFQWRSARGIAAELGATEADVAAVLESLLGDQKVKRFSNTNPKAPAVYAAA
ncbi:MAG: hypothetical protein CHACPFDD_02478 [Phycisphaerae bacterium]|nr:hypothetical protein [Phycisphaerae bacterium]